MIEENRYENRFVLLERFSIYLESGRIEDFKRSTLRKLNFLNWRRSNELIIYLINCNQINKMDIFILRVKNFFQPQTFFQLFLLIDKEKKFFATMF